MILFCVVELRKHYGHTPNKRKGFGWPEFGLERGLAVRDVEPNVYLAEI